MFSANDKINVTSSLFVGDQCSWVTIEITSPRTLSPANEMIRHCIYGNCYINRITKYKYCKNFRIRKIPHVSLNNSKYFVVFLAAVWIKWRIQNFPEHGAQKISTINYITTNVRWYIYFCFSIVKLELNDMKSCQLCALHVFYS